MNERIEQLAEQTGMHRDKFGMYFAGDKHDEDGVDLEKFAELIIKECAEVLNTWNRENGAEEGLDKEGLISLWSSHFGVEE